MDGDDSVVTVTVEWGQWEGKPRAFTKQRAVTYTLRLSSMVSTFLDMIHETDSGIRASELAFNCEVGQFAFNPASDDPFSKRLRACKLEDGSIFRFYCMTDAMKQIQS